MPGLTTTYSHAAPYIREQLLNAASLKLSQSTQRERKFYTGMAEATALLPGL